MWPMLKRLSFTLMLTSWLASAGATDGFAEKRAFLVGTNDYANVDALRTAVTDAVEMSKKFQEIGFTVSLHKDLTKGEFDGAWTRFLNSIKAGDVVAFYFAGHGVQVDGANYLLPKNIQSTDVGQAAFLERSVNFHVLMEELQARQPALSFYVLDACRTNPFKGKSAQRGKGTLGQTKGLARMESVYSAFVMYSAGADEEALDSSKLAPTRATSVYINQLLPLLATADLSLVDTAKRVQVAVDEEARALSHQQRPAYFDGVLGQYFLARPDGATVAKKSTDSIVGPMVVRLGGFATWDANCQSRPAPRIAVTTPPTLGRIVLRYEPFDIAGKHFGNACDKSKQRGVGVYYAVNESNSESTTIDRVKFSVKHWSIAPVTSVDETFEIDLATRYSKRMTQK
jgi:hypothetical protein